MNRHHLHPQETERETWMMASSHDQLFARKMAVVLVLSVSVLSISMVYDATSSSSSSSSSIASFLHYYYSMLLLSYSVDINKCIFFLLCNGLLVFVAKSSPSLLNNDTRNVPLIYSHNCYYGNTESPPFLPPPPSSLLENDETAEESIIKEVVFVDSGASLMTNSHHHAHHDHHENDKEEEGLRNVHSDATDDEEEGELVVVAKQNVDERDYESHQVMEAEEDDYHQFPEGKEEDEEGILGVLSTEELNRRFDEFIRKIKEEIRIESQLHLVLV